MNEKLLNGEDLGGEHLISALGARASRACVFPSRFVCLRSRSLLLSFLCRLGQLPVFVPSRFVVAVRAHARAVVALLRFSVSLVRACRRVFMPLGVVVLTTG